MVPRPPEAQGTIKTSQILDAQTSQFLGTVDTVPVNEIAAVSSIASTFPKEVPPDTINAFDGPFGERKYCHVIHWDGSQHRVD